MKAKIINYGGIVAELDAPDHDGKMGEMVLDGELKPVKGTPFDFTKPEKIGARIVKLKTDPATGLHRGAASWHDEVTPASSPPEAAILSVADVLQRIKGRVNGAGRRRRDGDLGPVVSTHLFPRQVLYNCTAYT